MIHVNSVESPGRAPEIENLIPPSSSQSTKPTLCWQTLICGYFDEDQEGKITRKEFVEKPSAFIRRFDRNGDCRVTADEIEATNVPKRSARTG